MPNAPATDGGQSRSLLPDESSEYAVQGKCDEIETHSSFLSLSVLSITFLFASTFKTIHDHFSIPQAYSVLLTSLNTFLALYIYDSTSHLTNQVGFFPALAPKPKMTQASVSIDPRLSQQTLMDEKPKLQSGENESTTTSPSHEEDETLRLENEMSIQALKESVQLLINTYTASGAADSAPQPTPSGGDEESAGGSSQEQLLARWDMPFKPGELCRLLTSSVFIIVVTIVQLCCIWTIVSNEDCRRCEDLSNWFLFLRQLFVNAVFLLISAPITILRSGLWTIRKQMQTADVLDGYLGSAIEALTRVLDIKARNSTLGVRQHQQNLEHTPDPHNGHESGLQNNTNTKLEIINDSIIEVDATTVSSEKDIFLSNPIPFMDPYDEVRISYADVVKLKSINLESKEVFMERHPLACRLAGCWYTPLWVVTWVGQVAIATSLIVWVTR